VNCCGKKQEHQEQEQLAILDDARALHRYRSDAAFFNRSPCRCAAPLRYMFQTKSWRQISLVVQIFSLAEHIFFLTYVRVEIWYFGNLFVCVGNEILETLHVS
jgi:hypothetical protein